MGRMSLMGSSVGGHVNTYLPTSVLKNCVKILQMTSNKNKMHSRGPIKNNRILDMSVFLVLESRGLDNKEAMRVLITTEKKIVTMTEIHTSMISSALVSCKRDTIVYARV